MRLSVELQEVFLNSDTAHFTSNLFPAVFLLNVIREPLEILVGTLAGLAGEFVVDPMHLQHSVNQFKFSGLKARRNIS